MQRRGEQRRAARQIERIAVPIEHDLRSVEAFEDGLLRGASGEVDGAPADFANDRAARCVRVDARSRSRGEQLRAEANAERRKVALDRSFEERNLRVEKWVLGIR